MNKWNGTGRFTKDPVIKYSQNENHTCIARFTLAVDRKFKRDNEPTADFINCVAMGKIGEFVEKYFHKGMKADVSGRIQTGSYTNKEGQTVYTTDIVIEDIEFGESKKVSQYNTSDEKPVENADDGFMNVPDDIESELPFT